MRPTRSRKVPIPEGEIASFCKRWDITELALFGSVLKEDLVSRRGLEMSRNHLRRDAILSASEVIYAA
jgi:hypothetical protein